MNDSLSRRRQRVQLIRGRVVAGALALFVAVFGGITAQLAAGHDPALSTSSAAKTTTTTTTTTAKTAGATQPSTQKKQSTALSPVTTRQS